MNKPEFWDSMTSAQAISEEEQDHPSWRTLASVYQNWKPTQTVAKPVPRIIHQIWLGSPLPKLYGRWAETWSRAHPEWEYRLWTEKEIEDFGLKNRRSFDLSPNYGVKSDIARYEILERLGGVYADTDFECLGSFEELCGSTSFFAGLMYGSSPAINNGLIGSIPHHPILTTMMGAVAEPFAGHDGMEVLAYSGPTRFTNVVCSHMEQISGDTLILPTTFFYPFPNRDIELKDLKVVKSWAKPESIAVHYWEVSWRQQSIASKLYWVMKKRLPNNLFRILYRIVKGKNPA